MISKFLFAYLIRKLVTSVSFHFHLASASGHHPASPWSLLRDTLCCLSCHRTQLVTAVHQQTRTHSTCCLDAVHFAFDSAQAHHQFSGICNRFSDFLEYSKAHLNFFNRCTVLTSHYNVLKAHRSRSRCCIAHGAGDRCLAGSMAALWLPWAPWRILTCIRMPSVSLVAIESSFCDPNSSIMASKTSSWSLEC